MKELEQRILKDGQLLGNDILKVGSFLNQQVDTALLVKMAQEVKRLFPEEITKVLTIEASGLPFACMVAVELGVPFVFAKKSKTSNVSGDVVTAKVHSFTHNIDNIINVPKDYIKETDKILIVDDFLANGEALNGLIEIVEKCKASVVGCCVQIEKAYQNGGNTLRNQGYKVIALASIKEMTSNIIQFN
ncbi:MAG: xanthine phosphoribosyltransferase [Bacilli bacterium]|nr:xanthine phosphoribosyltransferase [Bacilli bacterium]